MAFYRGIILPTQSLAIFDSNIVSYNKNYVFGFSYVFGVFG